MKIYFSIAALLISSPWTSGANDRTPALRKDRFEGEVALSGKKPTSHPTRPKPKPPTPRPNNSPPAPRLSMKELPGKKLMQISCNTEGDDCWGVADDDTVWTINGAKGTFSEVGGQMRSVSVDEKGSQIWGVDTSSNVKYINGVTGDWESPENKQIKMQAVSTDMECVHIWGVGKQDGKPYSRRTVEGVWKKQDSPDGNPFLTDIAVSGDAEHIWAVDKNGKVYYRNGIDAGHWTKSKFPSNFRIIQVSACDDDTFVFAVGKDSRCGNKSQLYRIGIDKHGQIRKRRIETSLWPDIVKNVNVIGNGKEVWVIDSRGIVCYAPNVIPESETITSELEEDCYAPNVIPESETITSELEEDEILFVNIY